jgi:hypothetical protein
LEYLIAAHTQCINDAKAIAIQFPDHADECQKVIDSSQKKLRWAQMQFETLNREHPPKKRAMTSLPARRIAAIVLGGMLLTLPEKVGIGWYEPTGAFLLGLLLIAVGVPIRLIRTRPPGVPSEAELQSMVDAGSPEQPEAEAHPIDVPARQVFAARRGRPHPLTRRATTADAAASLRIHTSEAGRGLYRKG